MAVLDRAIKDPDAILPYTLDWSQWLDFGDSIDTAAWTVTPATLIVGDGGNGAPAPSIPTPSTTEVWLLDGDVGVTYLVSVRITTSPAPTKTEDRTVAIVIQER